MRSTAAEDRSALDELVLSLYDAVGNEAELLDAMGRLAGIVGAREYGFILRESTTMRPVEVFGPGTAGRAFEAYRRHLYRFDTLARVALEEPAGSLFLSDEMQLKSPIHRKILDAFGRLGLGRYAGTWFPYDNECFLGVTFVRSRDSGPFLESHLSVIREVLPHLCRVGTLHFRVRAATNSGTLGQAVVDGAFDGVVLFDGNLRIIDASELGIELLRSLRGVRLDGGRQLLCDDPNLADQLLEVLETAPEGDRTWWQPAEDGRSILLKALQIAGSDATTLEDGRPRLTLVLADPERRARIPIAWLRERYGLTRKEANVAAALVRGHSLEQIADVGGNSVGTIRNHLKQVYMKTGCRGQVELVSKLLTTCPPTGTAHPTSQLGASEC